ncbi:hypothetical protein ABT104_08870 [Streptomyces mobaraensis]|uniref:hypothetical protein n=1 Tax=Streptomyces mobaraensis TaxID=35621 RepID=UPI00331C9E96
MFPPRGWEQDAPLRDGRAHVGFLRRPFDDAGLRTASIGREHKVLCPPPVRRPAVPRSRSPTSTASRSSTSGRGGRPR